MILSKEQQDIYDYVRNNDRSLIIDSTAGSGKTSSLIHAIIPALIAKGKTYDEMAVLMFSKAIQVEFELKARLAGIRARISTFHSVGLGLLIEAFGTKMDKDKLRKLGEIIKITNWEIYKLVTLAKTEGFNLVDGRNGDLDGWEALAEEYSFELSAGEIFQAMTLFDLSNQDKKTCDFSDMIYLPVQEKLKTNYKVALFDEIQDSGGLRIEFMKTIFSNATIYGVGDPNQSIFGFAGSDENAMSKIKSDFDAHTLPLHVSWRCSAAVTRQANYLVPHMRALPNAPQGLVKHITRDEFEKYNFSSETFILCRVNAPLLEVLFSLLSRGYKARIQGRDFGEELINITKKWVWKNFSELLIKLNKYLEKQREKLLPENYRAFGAINDKIKVISLLIEKCIAAGRTQKEDLPFFVREIFKDDGPEIVLSTIHRVKGLERKDVFIWGEDKYKANWIRQPWEKREEKRIKFVGITRAKENLYYVDLSENNDENTTPKKSYKKLPQKGPGTFKQDFKYVGPKSDDIDF